MHIIKLCSNRTDSFFEVRWLGAEVTRGRGGSGAEVSEFRSKIPLFCLCFDLHLVLSIILFTCMWTLPDHRGGSLKWALKFLLKHTTFYQNFKISLKELRIFLYILYIFEKPPWNEMKISLMPFWNLSYVCVHLPSLSVLYLTTFPLHIFSV